MLYVVYSILCYCDSLILDILRPVNRERYIRTKSIKLQVLKVELCSSHVSLEEKWKQNEVERTRHTN